MKKSIIQFLLALLPWAIFSQTALYVEFNGSGIPHRGVIVLDETGKGVCLIAYPMNGQQISVLQDASLLKSNGSFWDNYEAQQRGQANGWQTNPAPQQPQAITVACRNPRDLQTGQAASGYTCDNFIFNSYQSIVKSGNFSAPVVARQIQSQQELENLFQQLGLVIPNTASTTPNGKAPPPTSLPKGTPPDTPKPPGPKYPTRSGGGLGGG